MAFDKRMPYAQSMTLEEVVARCEYAPLHTKYRVYVREPHPRAARPLMSLNENRAACRAMMAGKPERITNPVSSP